MQSAASEQVIAKCGDVQRLILQVWGLSRREKKKKAECEQTKSDAMYLIELRRSVGECRGVFVGFSSFQAHSERC